MESTATVPLYCNNCKLTAIPIVYDPIPLCNFCDSPAVQQHQANSSQQQQQQSNNHAPRFVSSSPSPDSISLNSFMREIRNEVSAYQSRNPAASSRPRGPVSATFSPSRNPFSSISVSSLSQNPVPSNSAASSRSRNPLPSTSTSTSSRSQNLFAPNSISSSNLDSDDNEVEFFDWITANQRTGILPPGLTGNWIGGPREARIEWEQATAMYNLDMEKRREEKKIREREMEEQRERVAQRNREEETRRVVERREHEMREQRRAWLRREREEAEMEEQEERQKQREEERHRLLREERERQVAEDDIRRQTMSSQEREEERVMEEWARDIRAGSVRQRDRPRPPSTERRASPTSNEDFMLAVRLDNEERDNMVWHDAQDSNQDLDQRDSEFSQDADHQRADDYFDGDMDGLAQDLLGDVVPAIAPASQDLINTLETLKLTRQNFAELTGEDEKQCAICQEDYKVGNRALRLPCEHFFHQKCVQQWLKNSASCPMCRSVISPEDNRHIRQTRPGTSRHQSNQEQDWERREFPFTSDIRGSALNHAAQFERHLNPPGSRSQRNSNDNRSNDRNRRSLFDQVFRMGASTFYPPDRRNHYPNGTPVRW